jgi:hypothetical protein
MADPLADALRRRYSAEGDDEYAAMSPVDAWRLRTELQGASGQYATDEEKAKNAQTNAEFVLGMIPGPANVLSARDAYNSGSAAIEEGSQGNLKRALFNAGASGLAAFGAVTGLPFGKAAGNAARGASSRANIFAGPAAKTADHGALANAKQLADAGATRDDIWRETGWFQGTDGKWRFEIPDDSARLIEGDGRAIAGIDHPALREAYDDAPQVGGRFGPGVQEEGFNFEGKLAAFGPTKDSARAVALHEIQHDIQQREGFARGTSPLYLALSGKVKFPKDVEQQIQAISKQQRKLKPDTPEYDALGREQLRIKEQAAMGAYARAAGEVEARNVQSRAAMSPDERRGVAPWKTQDVPDEHQILDFPEAAKAPETGYFDALKRALFGR